MRKALTTFAAAATVSAALGISEERKIELEERLDKEIEKVDEKNAVSDVISNIWSDDSLTDEEVAYCLVAITHEEGKLFMKRLMEAAHQEEEE